MNDYSNILTNLEEEDYEELRNSGLNDSHINRLGHFSILCAKESVKRTGIRHRGLVFSYVNPLTRKPYTRSDGHPYHRIKPRDWEEDDMPKYLSPANEGNKPYWSQLIEDFGRKAKKTSVTLEIVEGEKKADSLASEGLFVLGLAGVYSWLDKTPRIQEMDIKPAQLIEDDPEEQDLKKKKLPASRIIPEIVEAIEWKGRRVNITFDSDITDKPNVKTAARALASKLSALGAICYFVKLPNEIGGGKNGPDDFKVRHGIKSYKQLCKVASRKLEWADPENIEKVAMAVAILKDSWRYRPGIGWMHWTGTFWEYKLDCEFESALIDFQDSQGWRKISGMDTQVRQLKGRLLTPEKSWNPSDTVIFENGTLTLTSGKFEEKHFRETFNTSVLPYCFNPLAECPIWLKFLGEAVGDENAIALLRAFIKWILIPKPKDRKTEIEKCLDLVGTKGSGKGTFIDVLIGLVGSDSVGAIGQSTFKDTNCLAELKDKKLSIDSDAFGFLANVGLFNKVVSNEPVTVKRLYKDSVSSRLGTVIVRAYNRFLEVPDGSEGLDRRIIAISFDNKPKAVDLSLSDKLRKELPGIFQWAWSVPFDEVKKRLMAAGEVQSVRRASKKRFEANNPEFLFLNDYFPDGGREKVSALYLSYSEWCKEAGISQKKRRKFMETVNAFGISSARSTGGNYWADIPRMSNFDVSGFLGISKEVQCEVINEESSLIEVKAQEEGSLTQTEPSQEVSPKKEQSEVKQRESFAKEKNFSPVPSQSLKTYTGTIGIGDWVKYRRNAPDSIYKVSCGSKKLEVLAFRTVEGQVEAQVQAKTWIDSEWIELKFLRLFEAKTIELFRLGDQVAYLENTPESALTGYFGFNTKQRAKSFIKEAEFNFNIGSAQINEGIKRVVGKYEVEISGDLDINRIKGFARKEYGWSGD